MSLTRPSWSNLSLRSKGVVVLAVPVTAFLVSMTALYLSTHRGAEVQRAVETEAEQRSRTRSLLIAILDAESIVHGYLSTGASSSLHRYETARSTVGARLAALERAYGPAHTDDMAAVRSLTERRMALLHRLRHEPPGEGRDALWQQGLKVSDFLRSTIDDILDRIDGAIGRRSLEASRLATRSQRLAIVGGAIGLLGGIAGMLFFTSGVVARVRRLAENAVGLSKGEPPRSLPPGDDEIGQLGAALVRTHELLAIREAQVAKQSSELRRQALTDELTGLRNRRAFMELAAHQLRVARRTGHPLTVLFIDLDGMKRINDEHGHAAGDEALRETASILDSTFRGADIVARLGGDEFCALLLDCPPPATQRVCARLQEAVASSNRSAARPFRLSLCVGVAQHQPGEDVTVEELLRRADAALYAQKATPPRGMRASSV